MPAPRSSFEAVLIDESDWCNAADGLGLSFDKPIEDREDFDRRARRILEKNSPSEAKFLRQMVIWIRIRAPRYWWQEFATYRVGVEVQSASTMHTVLKRRLEPTDFQHGIDDGTLVMLNEYRARKDWYSLKRALPESFLQERVVMASYQALRGMYRDRVHHRLPEWQDFCEFLRTKPAWPHLITAGLPGPEVRNGS